MREAAAARLSPRLAPGRFGLHHAVLLQLGWQAVAQRFAPAPPAPAPAAAELLDALMVRLVGAPLRADAAAMREAMPTPEALAGGSGGDARSQGEGGGGEGGGGEGGGGEGGGGEGGGGTGGGGEGGGEGGWGGGVGDIRSVAHMVKALTSASTVGQSSRPCSGLRFHRAVVRVICTLPPAAISSPGTSKLSSPTVVKAGRVALATSSRSNDHVTSGPCLPAGLPA